MEVGSCWIKCRTKQFARFPTLIFLSAFNYCLTSYVIGPALKHLLIRKHTDRQTQAYLELRSLATRRFPQTCASLQPIHSLATFPMLITFPLHKQFALTYGVWGSGSNSDSPRVCIMATCSIFQARQTWNLNVQSQNLKSLNLKPLSP